jgi:hypothetical protein
MGYSWIETAYPSIGRAIQRKNYLLVEKIISFTLRFSGKILTRSQILQMKNLKTYQPVPIGRINLQTPIGYGDKTTPVSPNCIPVPS